MNKKILLVFGGLFAISLAVLVAAFAFDSDGGDNIWEKGTCISGVNSVNSTLTDFCQTSTVLREAHPYGSDSCNYYSEYCDSYNATCSDGACIPN